MKNSNSVLEQCIVELRDEIVRAREDTINQIISDIHLKLDRLGIQTRVDLIPTALVVIQDELKNILMLHRTLEDRSYPDTYCFPGGKADDNESLIVTAVRETKEETSLGIDIEAEFQESYVPLEHRGRIYLVKPYVATPKNRVLRPQDVRLSEEHDFFEILQPEVALDRDEDPQDPFRLPGKLTRHILHKVQ